MKIKTGRIPPRPFLKGNKHGTKQTPHPGGGVKPNWFKEKCAKILQNKRLFDFLGDVSSGDDVESFVTADGRVIKVPAKVRERITAICELRDTAYGRPSQHVDVTNDQALMDLLSTVSLLIKQKVSRACPHCHKDLEIREGLAREFLEVAARFSAKTNTPVAVAE